MHSLAMSPIKVTVSHKNYAGYIIKYIPNITVHSLMSSKFSGVHEGDLIYN